MLNPTRTNDIKWRQTFSCYVNNFPMIQRQSLDVTTVQISAAITAHARIHMYPIGWFASIPTVVLSNPTNETENDLLNLLRLKLTNAIVKILLQSSTGVTAIKLLRNKCSFFTIWAFVSINNATIPAVQFEKGPSPDCLKSNKTL